MTSRRTAAMAMAMVGGLQGGALADPAAPQVGPGRLDREDAAALDEALKRLDPEHQPSSQLNPAPATTAPSHDRDAGYALTACGVIGGLIGTVILASGAQDGAQIVGFGFLGVGVTIAVVGVYKLQTAPAPVQVSVSAGSHGAGLVVGGRW